MRVAVIFNKHRPDTSGIYFERAFRQLGHEVTWRSFDAAAQLRQSQDLYMRIDDGDNYDRGLPPHCRPSAYWISDTHLPGPMKKLLRGARAYDVVFCAMRRGTEQLQAHHIPATWIYGGAYDAEIHKRIETTRGYDLGFVGTDGGTPRKFYLQALRERFPNSFIGLAPYHRMAEIYSRSRIGFNYCPTQDSLTMRCFEMMACGALLLLNEVPGHTHREMGFVPGTHMMLYRTPDELLTQIDYFLTHESERHRIAEAGYQETVARHTYRHRVEAMCAVIARQLGGRYATELSPRTTSVPQLT